MRNWQKMNEIVGSVNRGTPCESGLCTQCRTDCQGKCETFVSSFKGRRTIYSQEPTGTVIYGSDNINPIGVSYNSLRVQGKIYGAKGIADRSSEACVSANVDYSTEFGVALKTKCRVPISQGPALNAVSQYWPSYAMAAAIVGYPLVIGENAMNMDKEMVVTNGKVTKAPRIDKMIDTFLRYDQGYGGIVVQVNYDDVYQGSTIDYICEKYGNKVIMEIKWSQGGKIINGEVITKDLAHAKFMSRHYPIFPNPNDPKIEKIYAEGGKVRFTRQSRVPHTALDTYEQVEKEFVSLVDRIRAKGIERVLLKIGGMEMGSLAMALKVASKAKIDLVTIDGSGGGTAHSPWPMMEHTGVPSVLVHAKAYEYNKILADKGEFTADLSFAGGLAKPDHIYKAMALGAPFCKIITLGRAIMIPGFVGSNIEGVLYPERKTAVHGAWDKLPAIVQECGSTPEEIFEGYDDFKNMVGTDMMKDIPLGAVAIWTYIDKLMVGMQQLMAGARSFNIASISREDIASANRETERETQIPFITEAQDELAKQILNG